MRSTCRWRSGRSGSGETLRTLWPHVRCRIAGRTDSISVTTHRKTRKGPSPPAFPNVPAGFFRAHDQPFKRTLVCHSDGRDDDLPHLAADRGASAPSRSRTIPRCNVGNTTSAAASHREPWTPDERCRRLHTACTVQGHAILTAGRRWSLEYGTSRTTQRGTPWRDASCST